MRTKRIYRINEKGDCHADRAYRIIQKELSIIKIKTYAVMDAKRMRVSGKSWEHFAEPHFHEKLAYAGASERLPTITTFHGICQYSSQYLHRIHIQKLAMGNTCPGSLRSSRPANRDVVPLHRCKYNIKHRPHDCNRIHNIHTILFPPGSKRLRKQRKANSGNDSQF